MCFNLLWTKQVMYYIILFSITVPAEGICKHFIILGNMANYNII